MCCVQKTSFSYWRLQHDHKTWQKTIGVDDILFQKSRELQGTIKTSTCMWLEIEMEFKKNPTDFGIPS